MFDTLRQRISTAILHYLAKPTKRYAPFFAPDIEVVRKSLQLGDIILVEGNTRLSAVIKFLTQSTWSHAALVIGEYASDSAGGEPRILLEAEAETGVTTVPLSKYAQYNLRICRPVGLDMESRRKIAGYAMARI